MVFSASEVCYVLDLSWVTLKKLVRNGDIRVKRVGRRYLFPKEAIDYYLNKEAFEAKVFLKGLR